MNNDDTEIVCDDFIVEDFFICECGVTFSDEETLQSHLESSHTVPKSEQTEAVEEQNSFLEGDTVEETVIASEYTSFPFEHMDISDIDVKEEVNIEDQRVLSLPSSSKTVAVLVTSDGVQSCKEVDFAEGPVILVGENIEHDYGTCLPKAEVQDLYFCDQCGRSFDNPKSVRLHKSRLHTPEGAPKVRFMRRGVCQLCHTAYTDVEQSAVCECGGKLVRGKRLRVAPGTLYTCEHCGATRQSAAALRYHLRTHTGEKPYACEHCDKAFSMPIFLQIHTRIHTGERPYPCKLCPKAFTNKAAWNRHARVHTGEKPYVCSECGKAFSQSNSMKLHIHTVHLRLPTPYKSQQRRRHQNALELRPKTSKSKGRQVLSTIDDGVATVSPATARLLAAGGLFRHKDDTLRRLDRLRYEEEEEEEMDSEEDVLVEETEYYEIQDAEGHSFIRTSPVAVDFALTPHQRFFVDK